MAMLVDSLHKGLYFNAYNSSNTNKSSDGQPMYSSFQFTDHSYKIYSYTIDSQDITMINIR